MQTKSYMEIERKIQKHAMDESEIASLRYLLAYVERWNKKDEDEEAAHAQEVLEYWLENGELI